MPGFGSSYFGLFPGGFGLPVGAPAPGASFVRTVDNVLARKLDTANLDVVVDLDETGAPHEDWDPLYQQVIFALTTPLGSLPFDAAFGNEWLLLDKAPLDLAGFADRSARTALRSLTDAGQIAILSVASEQQGGLAIQAVTWLDRRTRAERGARIPRL